MANLAWLLTFDLGYFKNMSSLIPNRYCREEVVFSVDVHGHLLLIMVFHSLPERNTDVLILITAAVQVI